MPWVRVDDRFNEHPKLAAVGPAGWGVWLAGLAYCNRNLTDGFIPYAVAEGIGGAWTVRLPDGEAWRLRRARVGPGPGVGAALEAGFVIGLLVAHGLWAEVAGGYRIHDYADYQPSKAAVLDGRERTRQRVERHRGTAGEVRSAAASDAGRTAGAEGAEYAGRNGVTARLVTPAPVSVPGPGPGPIPGADPGSLRGARSAEARGPADGPDRVRLAGLLVELSGRRTAVALERGFGALAVGHLERHGWAAVEPAYRAVAAACPRPPTLRQLVFGADDLLDRPPERRILAAAEREAEAVQMRRRRAEASRRALHRQHFAPEPGCRLCTGPSSPPAPAMEATDVA